MSKTICVVDTHALIWFLSDDSRLGAKAKLAMSDPDSDMLISAVALAEACWIVDAGRTTIPTVKALLTALDSDPRIQTVPLDRTIIDVSQTLKSIGEMHDRQIVALAVHLQNQGEQVALLTKDANIVASGLVSVVW